MGLDNLSPAKGSVKNRKRIGRGNATGQGRTAGKGHKGYKSRSGASNRFHFEGGQTPMARRIPKRGLGTGKFNHMQTKDLVQTVNLDRLEKVSVEKIDINTLVEEGIIKKANNPVKILGNGEI
ncbi:MAG: 50S ribosomal protein L15, partial [Candidatus Marinimicrobia bacterium]|nr:50S ribosomal protein L15 [Candidatus Neomarinimicrobiota bacterium]